MTRILSAAITGLDARLIEVEVDLTPGLHVFKKHCQTDSTGEALLRNAVDKMNLSARGYHRILKLARTIADLSGQENITRDHIAEALQYRQKEMDWEY
jgi:predicted ATPase with chaperone activity